MTHKSVLDQVEVFASDIFNNDFSEKFVYHNILFVRKLIANVNIVAEHEKLTEEEKELALIAGWFFITGFKEVSEISPDQPEEYFQRCNQCSQAIARNFLTEINYPKEKIETVISVIRDASFDVKEKSKPAAVLNDAINMRLTEPKAKKTLQKLYEELLLMKVISIGKGDWFEIISEHLNNIVFYTEYGQKNLSPKVGELRQKIRKEQKQLAKQQDEALTKELNISESELKALKKALHSVKGRDEKGIQTIFRTTIKTTIRSMKWWTEKLIF